MTTVQLYKNGSAIGPVQTEGSVEYGQRLIADEGKILYKAATEEYAPVIDIYPGDDSVWTEIDDPGNNTEADFETIGKILTGEEGE